MAIRDSISLHQVVDSTVSVSSAISNIASTTDEHSNSITQVTTSVDQISAGKC